MPTSGMPYGSASPESSPSSNPSSNSSSSGSTVSRNPVGRSADWIRQDGLAQGAIKAGAKGGVIGLGVYATKAGASKIGEKVSARFGDKGISSDPDGNLAAYNDNMPLNDQPFANIGNPAGSGAAGSLHGSENLGEYQDSRPLHDMEGNAPMPASIDGGEYRDTSYYDNTDTPNEANPIATSFNDDDYRDVNSFNAAADTSPISYVAGAGGEDGTWYDSKPVDITSEMAQVPASANSEDWNEAAPSDNVSVANADSAIGNAPASASDSVMPATKGAISMPPRDAEYSDLDTYNGSEKTFEPQQMSLNNQAISSGLPENTPPPISAGDTAVRDSVEAGSIASAVDFQGNSSQKASMPVAQTKVQPDITGINANSNTSQSEVVQLSQTQTSALIVTETGTPKPGQATSQPAPQLIQTETHGHGGHTPGKTKQGTGNIRPTARAEPKGTAKAHGRKR
jgi:hypothetical protein